MTYYIEIKYQNGTGNIFTIEASSKESALKIAKYKMRKLLNKYYDVTITVRDM